MEKLSLSLSKARVDFGGATLIKTARAGDDSLPCPAWSIMKPTSSHPNHWKKAAAIAGLLLASGSLAQAQDLTFTLKRDIRITSETSPVEARRIPAIKRIRLGLTPYVFEGRNGALYRHDEITSNVLAVHTRRIAGQMALYPGHSLAPNLAQIVSR